LQVKLCDPRLSALSVPWCKKALYKYSSFPFFLYQVASTQDPSSRLATIDMGRKLGVCACPFGGSGAGSPSNRRWPGPSPASMQSFTLIHPAVWQQKTWAADYMNAGKFRTQLPSCRGYSPQFSAHVRCCLAAGWTKMPLGLEVGLGPGDSVRWGPSSP